MRKGKKEETDGLCYFLFSNIFLYRVFFLTMEKEKKIQRKKSKYKRKGKKKNLFSYLILQVTFPERKLGKPRGHLHCIDPVTFPFRRGELMYITTPPPSPLNLISILNC